MSTKAMNFPIGEIVNLEYSPTNQEDIDIGIMSCSCVVKIELDEYNDIVAKRVIGKNKFDHIFPIPKDSKWKKLSDFQKRAFIDPVAKFYTDTEIGHELYHKTYQIEEDKCDDIYCDCGGNFTGTRFNGNFADLDYEQLGIFNIDSGRLIVGDVREHVWTPDKERREKIKTPPINFVQTGEWNVYFLQNDKHWDYKWRQELQEDGDRLGSGIVCHSSLTLKNLNQLIWEKCIAPINGNFTVCDYPAYGNMDYLPKELIDEVYGASDLCEEKKWYDVINKAYYLNDWKDCVLLLSNQVVFDTPEMRGRDYFIGRDVDTVKAIVLPNTW